MKAGNSKYDYVSFSELQFRYNPQKLVNNAADWKMIESERADDYDVLSFRQAYDQTHPFPGDVLTNDNSLSCGEKILHLLSHDHFRSGDISFIEESRDVFLKVINDAISNEKPVEIIIPSFPGREVNPIARTRPQLHLGEVASICRLAQLAEISRKIYSPGVVFIIVTDGVAYSPFYGDPLEGARNYQNGLKALVNKLGCDELIHLEDLADIIDKRRSEFDEVYKQTEEEIKAVWQDENYSFRSELEYTMRMGTQSAALNAAAVHLVKFMQTGTDQDVLNYVRSMQNAIKQRATETSYVYQCLLVTLRKMDLLGQYFPNAIRGTVHAKKGQYAPHLVNKETNVSPWHGVPVMRKNGRIDILLEAEILSSPEQFVAVYVNGEVLPFYYREK